MRTITVETRKDTLELEFTLSWGDFAEAEHALRRMIRTEQGRSVQIAIPFMVAATLALIGGVLVWSAVNEGALGMTGLVLLAMAPIALAVGSLIERRIDRRNFAQFRNNSRRKQRCLASVNGMKFEQGSLRIEFPWSAVSRTYRLGGSLVLFLGNLTYFLIPDRAFLTPGQQASFLNLLKARNSLSKH